ncbi:dienelactone hydrolase family protein [Steroidobacter sp.]|uniref:dienelactone hydrolase family protein n=1 Tax=Steroidobacter sp. TaxID=1978227 RepID=UPI001A4D3772|nr:dienelactone hydrolase family protein [Steroidobacter sp.]MBL8270908.1 dienelactone hydrolase family protein [Steroidobacter sp.]
MTRKTVLDFHPQVLKLFDEYVHGLIPRREFLKRAANYAAAGVAAEGLLELLNPRFAEAQQVEPNDERLETSRIVIPSTQGHGSVNAYLARPSASAVSRPVVLVVHENRGLNPHIEDIARRLALAGFIAVAPDALSSLGGYPGDEDQARTLFQKLDQQKCRHDFLAAVSYLEKLPGGNRKVGVVGFCYGGAIANFLATQVPTLAAAVPFYGGQAPSADAARIKSPIQLHFAENDERVNAGWPEYEVALKVAGVRYEAHTYSGTQHGFNNDTTPRYDAAAAALAWQRTVDFLAKELA